MLTVQDLMMGDWVRITIEGHRYPAYVNFLKYYTEEIGVAYLAAPGDWEDGDGYDDIEPIPLTPEILELNGFKGTAGRTVWEMEINKKYINIWGTHALSFSMNVPYLLGYKWIIQDLPINYVHELQHLLRQCGFTELANDFKVE